MSNTSDPMTPGRWMRAAAWRKRALAHEYYRGLDTVAREGISDEDYATTMATLEKMARNLGWEESQGEPGGHPWRARGYGRGHGRGHGRCGDQRGDQRDAKNDDNTTTTEKGDRENVGA